MKNLSSYILFFLIFLCFSQKNFSQKALFFSENKGQWHKNVLFKTNLLKGNLFLEKNAFTFDFNNLTHTHGGDNDTCKIHEKDEFKRHSYQLVFENANENSIIKGLNPAKDYENYFLGNDKKKWASYVKRYPEIYYQNIYNQIDLKVYSKDIYLKYDFILKPYANIDDIQLIYKGLDKIKIKKGNLVLTTSINEMQELKPFAYQIIKNDTISIKCKFHLKKNKVRFIVKNYNKNYPLIIDPILIFSTYSGSTSDNFGFTATFDYLDNVYSGGIVSGQGYPFNIGAYDTTYNGYANIYETWDIGIIKYNSVGTERLFATYVGGIRNDLPHSMVVNSQNELYIYGSTGSSDFPITDNGLDNTFEGGFPVFSSSIYHLQGTDMYVVKLSEDGSNLLASTFLGGSSNDAFNTSDSLAYNYGDDARGEIIVDKEDNVYVASCTFSNDFPLNNAYQSTSNGGMEGLVLKLNSDLSNLLWGTYLGGSSDDGVYSIDVDSNNDIYVTGGTISEDFLALYGSYDNTFNGGRSDAFICKFSQNGSLLKSTFFGSPNYDQAYFVKLDAQNNVYITGQTEASGMTLVNNADYFTANSGQFIAKFNANLNELIYSTVFGTGIGEPNISITAFTVDVCNRVYLSGWGRVWISSLAFNETSGTHNMEITPDAYQSITDGQDFYVMVLSDDASTLEYATFFGELKYDECVSSGRDHVDGGTSRFDKKGNIYQAVCASCGTCQEFPTTPGVWSEINNSNNCNNAVFKFNLEPNITIADFIPPLLDCAPTEIQFQNTSLGTDFIWDFGDGSALSYEENPTHLYNIAGVYNVKLIASNDESCNISDTIIKQIQILNSTETSLNEIDICIGDYILIGIDEVESDFPLNCIWQPIYNLSSPYTSQTNAFPQVTTTYTLSVETGNCNHLFHQTVNVENIALNIIENNDTTVCFGDDVTLTANPNENILSYHWSDNPNFTNYLNETPQDNFITVSSPIIPHTVFYYVKALSENCEKIDTIAVNYSFFKLTTTKDTTICIGDTISLNISDEFVGENLTCNWYCDDNSTILNANTINPLVFPSTNMTYYVEVNNELFCSGNTSINVDISNFDFEYTNISDPRCFGDCNGTARIITFPVDDYTYFSNGLESLSFIVNNLCAGENEIKVINSLSCEKIDTLILTQPDIISIDILEIINVSCYNYCSCNYLCDGEVTIEVNGGTPPYYVYKTVVGGGIGILSTNPNEEDFLNFSAISEENNFSNNINQAKSNYIFTLDNLCAKTYKIHVYDSNNCYQFIEVTITQPEPYLINILDINHIDCFGGDNGFVSISAIGGTLPYTYEWNNNENLTDSTLTNLVAGNYIIKITDSHNCIIIDTIKILQADPLNVIIPPHEILCFGDEIDILAQVTGGTEPYEFLWNDENQQITNPANLGEGNYWIYVNDINNCKDSASINLVEPPILEVSLIDTIHNHCNGACVGEAIVEASGGTPNYTYIWNTGFYGNHPVGLCPNIHTLTVIDDNLCTTYLDVEIKESSILDLELLYLENISCFGASDGSVAFQLEGGISPYIIEWNNNLVNDLSFENLDAGNYNLTIIDSDNCIAQSTVEITQAEELKINIIILDTIKCFGDKAKLKALVSGGVPPYEYSWTDENNNLLNNEEILQNLDAGIYTILIIDSVNCQTFEEIEIHEIDLLTIETDITNNLCFGDSLGSITLNISGGTPDYTINWSNEETSLTIDSLASGNYYVNVYDINNCHDSLNFTINEPPQLSFNVEELNDTILCFGGNTGNINLNITGGTEPYTFDWSDDVSDNNIANNLFSGTYNVNITDINNCLINDTFIITENPELILGANSISKLKCYDDLTSVLLYAVGGVESYVFILDDILVEAEDNFIHNVAIGEHELIVQDTYGCRDTSLFDVSGPDSLFAHISILEPNPCFGDCLGKLKVTAFGGIPDYTYYWNTESEADSIFDLCSGDYWVAIEDANNCKDTVLFELTDPSPLSLKDTIIDVSCFAYRDGSVRAFGDGGTKPYRYVWRSEYPFYTFGNEIKHLYADVYYYLELRDMNECKLTKQFILSQPEQIRIYASFLDILYCHEDSTDVLIHTTGGIPPYQYFKNDTIAQANLFEDLTDGYHVIGVKDSLGCVETFQLEVKSPPIFYANPIKHDAPCKAVCGGYIDMNVKGGTRPYDYFLNGEEVFQRTDNLCIGEYDLLIKDKNSCIIKDSLVIAYKKDIDKINIYAEKDTIYRGESVQLHLEVDGLFTELYWNNIETLDSYISPHPIAKPEESMLYNIYVKAQDGCNYYDTLNIYVKELICDDPYIFVPNAFSPNGDGKNDLLFVQSDVTSEIYFAIYNRWGNLVFETNDINKAWDGTYNGEKVEPSVLVYYIEATCLDETTFFKKGNITLIR